MFVSAESHDNDGKTILKHDVSMLTVNNILNTLKLLLPSIEMIINKFDILI